MLTSSLSAFAQQNQVWTDGSLQYKFTPKWILTTDLSSRLTVNGLKQDTYMLGSSIGYKITPQLTAIADVAWFYTDEPGERNTNEIRVYNGIRYGFPILKRVLLSQFLRLEQRYLSGLQSKNSVRLRFQLGATIPVNHPIMAPNTAYFNLSAEAFDNLTGSSSDIIVNRYRLTSGFGYILPQKIKTEVSYNVQPFRTSANPHFGLGEEFLRLRFIYPLN
ncbi:DUF2490 domain-containing protein [Solitalea koreensis]|uniref:DUF2490 domain-containing protein n=1 Tax=Solitalea koreensis TaxID=543615 RepID=UPI00163D84E2|nr:DUF2490 domain-containing protein [Solitalea koreensis]